MMGMNVGGVRGIVKSAEKTEVLQAEAADMVKGFWEIKSDPRSLASTTEGMVVSFMGGLGVTKVDEVPQGGTGF